MENFQLTPETSNPANQKAGAGSSPSSGSSVWNPLDDEFEEILGGSWAVIRTSDGWQIECQHSATTLPLKSTDMESAKIEGRKLARQFENRYQTNAECIHHEPKP